MESSVLIPITLWNYSKPVFRISTLCLTPNFKKLITGSYNGQLCLWDLDLNKKYISPKNILIGHKDSVTCMASTNEYVISSCEGKMMCRWNLDDGYCSKMNASLFVHRKMQFYIKNDRNEEFLFTCGDYSEIFVIHPFTLQVIYIFHSKNINMWISSFQIIKRQDSQFVSSITNNGCVKIWMFDDLLSDLPRETQSHILSITDVLDYSYNSDLTKILIVATNCWMLYNSEVQFSNYICRVEACKEERLVGGNFCENDIIIWTNSGKFHLYSLKENTHKQICIFLDSYSKITVFTPASSIIQFKAEKYLIRGDSQGRINIWEIDLQKEESYPLFSVALADKWVTNENGFFNSLVQYCIITCCICVFEIDKFFIGCLDGSIISIPATESLYWFYLNKNLEKPLTDILIGHNGRINCLLYPYEKYSYYNKSHLVSGGSDFSVCLWDILKNELLFKFCVQSGEILRLTLPPENSYMPLKLSICSISSDHSVAVLNLKNRRCLILTSRHKFPVVMVHWKPLDDFIIIECSDGTIYVWQIETGHLDRVLDGILAQEVIYACSETECNTSALNFYIQESNVKKNWQQKLYNIQESTSFSPFRFNKFLTNEVSESHIFLCDLETIFAQFSCDFESEILDCAINSDIYLLTKTLNNDLQKKTSTSHNNIIEENEIPQNKLEYSQNHSVKRYFENRTATRNDLNCSLFSESVIKLIQFFLSSIHYWGLDPSLDEIFSSKLSLLKPKKSICFGIQSQPGIYSLFLPSTENSCLESPSLFASVCVAVIALSKILLWHKTDQEWIESKKNYWKVIFSFYELASVDLFEEHAIPKPNIKLLTEAWRTKSLHLRNIIRKLLSNHLQGLGEKATENLLEVWYKYLPHFKIFDKTMPEKEDFENVDLKTVALVLFGILGSDLKFKSIDSSRQDNYVYQTCASFLYLLLLPHSQTMHFGSLQTIAIDFIGHGYIFWEQFLKIEKIIPILFKLCAGLSGKSFNLSDYIPTMTSNVGLVASKALKSIAIVRTGAFIKCLTNKDTKIKLGQDSHFLNNNFKTELLSILIFLLEKTPYIMLLYLNEVISLIVHCIDFSHLKHENLANLIPALRKFRQVHHSITSQRIAIGLATGFLVLYDLKTGKVHEIPAHKDSVSALKFSEDGKFLVSYSCYENRISFWEVLTGIFGLGQVQIKCAKSCQTYQIHDEEIRNHLDIASLTWTDKKSVVLSLCDGSEDTFHF